MDDRLCYEVIVTLAKDAEEGGYGRMFLRHETLPDSQWGHYDLPEAYISSAAATQEVTITQVGGEGGGGARPGLGSNTDAQRAGFT